ncbi:MAG: hypothetical protein AAF846_13595 [Chloroflexota bacterium]
MSPILEVLIGLIFIFSLLSILVTQINAIVAQMLRLRAQYLFNAVKDIIHDPEILARFVTHPLIKMIDFKDVPGMENWDHLLPNQKLTDEQAKQILQGTLNGIEWIEDKTFSSVLLSLIKVKEDRQLFIVLDDIAQEMEAGQDRRLVRNKINAVTETGEGIDDLISTINALPPSAHKKALVERLRDISKEIGDKGLKSDINVGLMAGVQYIKDQYLKNAIITILETSKTIDEVETKITNWFNNTNSKATELFARDMKWYSYLIGLIIAILLNVDTMYISLELWNDPVLRSTLAEVAANVDVDELQTQVDTANEQINSENPTTFDDLSTSAIAALQTVELLQDTRIPMGWDFANLSDLNENDPRLTDSRYMWNFIPGNNNPNIIWLISWKIIGLLATMVAVGQGAPFWFNVLRQVRG